MKDWMNNLNRLISKLFIGTALLSFAVLASCGEAFLDVASDAETDADITQDQAVELVNATYNSFLQWQMSSFSWIGITSIASDDADKGSDPGDTGADKQLLDALTFDATSISVAEVWEGHYNGIQRANQALSRIQAFEEIDENLKKRLIGEAKFLRALMYFRLLQTFGGVPLIAEVPDLNTPVEEILSRASRSETFAFIEEDLREAIASLPLKSEYPGTELGRATQGAAQALLAKVYMYQENWSGVQALTAEIINSGEYDLTPNYEDIWKASSENNIESIFEIQARGRIPQAGVDKYSTVQGARGSGGWGWGFNTPSFDLLNSYEEGDLRKDATIIFKGETLYDGRLVPETVVNDRYNQKAYSSAFTESEQTDKNIRILRFAEVLLMKAEAEIHLNGDAATPLNLVRNRSGLTSKDNPTILDVWKERRWELAFEHDRYFDLVRQGRAGVILRGLGKAFEDGKHELFPIPQEQITTSNGILTQNPGW